MTKKLLLLCLLWAMGKMQLQAQPFLYGYFANASNAGQISKYDVTADSFTVIYSGLSEPYCNVTKATDGKLYGVTNTGGTSSAGTIFSYDLQSSTYNKLFDFDITNSGNGPQSKLVQSGNKLYGTDIGGGATANGVLFSYDITTNTFAKVIDFNYYNGTGYGGLMLASDGILYGVSTYGGIIYTNNNTDSAYTFYGNIYSYNPANGVFTKNLYRFAFADDGSLITGDGEYPVGHLIEGSPGILYGMTSSGGINNGGTIFSYEISTGNYTKLHDFNTGDHPGGSLFKASNGKLYGLSTNGGSAGSGYIFSYDPATSTFTKIADLTNATYGTYPGGSFMQTSDGKLYATTSSTIISLDPSTNTTTLVKTLDINNHLPQPATSGGSGYFDDFLEISDGSLPLQLVNFTGASNNNGVLLNWQTLNENNTSDFSVERSINAREFFTIASVAAKGSGNNYYTYTDQSGVSKENMIYYRLKMIDKDGRYTYSKVISIMLHGAALKMAISPNPARSLLKVQVDNLAESGQIFITDLHGKIVIAQPINAGLNTVNISQLTKGTYFVSLVAGDTKRTQKLVIE